MIIGSKFIFLENTASTNTDAANLILTENAEEGTVVYTDFQSAGRGQKGNIWQSEKGKNLLFSIILYPSMISASEQFLISMIISLGLTDYLKSVIPECRIKWPNDIFAGDDKIAGILIENSLTGYSINSSVAGIGLNLNQDVFPGFVPKAVSLKILTGKEFSHAETLQVISGFLDKRYKQLISGEKESIRNDYISFLYRLGSWSLFRKGEHDFMGKIESVSDTGCLIVELKNGKREEFYFREIEFKY